MADRQFVLGGTESAPADWVPPAALEIIPKTAFATFDGTSASQAFVPCLEIISDSGHTVAFCRVADEVAAGASAIVSWFPGGELDTETQTPQATGGVESITSPGASIQVTNPSGPDTNLDLPASGVTAGTYGDGTHVPQVQVSADGIVTGASSVAIGGSSFVTVLFDQTLGASAASIDTGANGVAGGFSALMILVIGRGDSAVFSASFSLQFNGDTTNANYDIIWTDNSNGVSTSFISTATGAAKAMEGPGANIGAGVFGVAQVFIPGYTQTTAHKMATALGGFAETSGHSELIHAVNHWANTAAITRVKYLTGAGNLVAGSRMTIYGLP